MGTMLSNLRMLIASKYNDRVTDVSMLLVLVLGISFTAGGLLYDHQCVNYGMTSHNNHFVLSWANGEP